MQICYHYFPKQTLNSYAKKKINFNIASDFSKVCFDRTEEEIQRNESLYRNTSEQAFVDILFHKIQKLKEDEILCIDFNKLGALTFSFVDKACRLILVNKKIDLEQIYKKVCFKTQSDYFPDLFEQNIEMIIQKLTPA
ncbi:hypothetical protein CSB11_02790 [Candidatus Campbellbacteria bacterium]|nr:MAG: hypothetical protein CSB11_02790 [Candidatus Campbellbacteria bacterium]